VTTSVAQLSSADWSRIAPIRLQYSAKAGRSQPLSAQEYRGSGVSRIVSRTCRVSSATTTSRGVSSVSRVVTGRKGTPS
jgi:hypothetical protein